MSTRIGSNFRLVTTPDGRTIIKYDERAAEAKLDVSTRLKRRKSKKVRVVKRGYYAIVR